MEHGEQQRPKLAAPRVRPLNPISLQTSREELLGQVLCLMERAASRTEEIEDRLPVASDEPIHRGQVLRSVAVLQRLDEPPRGRLKPIGRLRSWHVARHGVTVVSKELRAFTMIRPLGHRLNSVRLCFAFSRTLRPEVPKRFPQFGGRSRRKGWSRRLGPRGPTNLTPKRGHSHAQGIPERRCNQETNRDHETPD